MYVFIPMFKPTPVVSTASVSYDICLLMSKSIGLETL